MREFVDAKVSLFVSVCLSYFAGIYSKYILKVQKIKNKKIGGKVFLFGFESLTRYSHLYRILFFFKFCDAQNQPLESESMLYKVPSYLTAINILIFFHLL